MFDPDFYFKEYNSFTDDGALSKELKVERLIFEIW